MSATAPTPRTLPASSWNGVAALRMTSITRDDFSSTTLIAIQFPYMMMIMKMRIVIPNASMSRPTMATVSAIGSVLAGSGHSTAKSAGAKSVAWSAGATPSRAEPVADARSRSTPGGASDGGPAGRVVVGEQRELELAAGRALDRRAAPRSRPSTTSARAGREVGPRG